MGMQKPSGPIVDEVDKNINWEWYPPDDEDIAFQLARVWKETANEVRAGAAKLDMTLEGVHSSWGDMLGQRYYTEARMFGYRYRELAKSFDQLGDFAQEYGELLQRTKDDIWTELAWGLAEAILTSALLGPASWPVALARAGARTAVRIAALVARMAASIGGRLAGRLTFAGLKLGGNLAKNATMEALDEGVTSFLQQSVANLRGTQQGIDWNQVGRDSITGAVSAPLSMGLKGLTNGAGSIGRRLGAPAMPDNIATRSVSSGLHNAVTSPVAGHIVETYEKGGDFFDPKGYVDAIKENGVQSAVIGGARTATHDATHLVADTIRGFGGDGGGPTGPPPTPAAPELNASNATTDAAAQSPGAGADQGGVPAQQSTSDTQNGAAPGSAGADPSATQDSSPSATRDSDPSATQGADPPATRDADPSASQDSNPSATRDSDPPATQGADTPATRDANSSATQDSDPSATQGADPRATQDSNPSATQDSNPPATQGADPPATQDSDPSATQDAAPPGPGDAGSAPSSGMDATQDHASAPAADGPESTPTGGGVVAVGGTPVAAPGASVAPAPAHTTSVGQSAPPTSAQPGPAAPAQPGSATSAQPGPPTSAQPGQTASPGKPAAQESSANQPSPTELASAPRNDKPATPATEPSRSTPAGPAAAAVQGAAAAAAMPQAPGDGPATSPPSRTTIGPPIEGAVPPVPHSGFHATPGGNSLLRNAIEGLARQAMTAEVARDAGLDVTDIVAKSNGVFEIVQRDGTTITVTVTVGPTQNGNLAEFTVDIAARTAVLSVSPNAGTTNIERTMANALAQIDQLVRGNTATTSVLTASPHPGANFDLSGRDHGRESEVRNLDRTAKETSRLRVLRRLRLASEMRALVEDLGAHPKQDGGLDRRALLNADVRTLLDEHAPETARRPSWVAKDPTGLPSLRAYAHQLVIQGLPGLAASAAVIATSLAQGQGPWSGIGVGVVTLGSTLAGTYLKYHMAAKDKKLSDANQKHAERQRDYEANQRLRIVLDTLFARARTMDVNPNAGPAEPIPRGPAPDKVHSPMTRVLTKAGPQVAGVALSAPLMLVGLAPLSWAAQAAVASLAALTGPIVDRFLKAAELTRKVSTVDRVARELADQAHTADVGRALLLHKLFDRVDALAGVQPAGPAPEQGDSIGTDPTTVGLPPYLGNTASSEIGLWIRALENLATGKDGAISLTLLRFVLGTITMAVLDKNFSRDELVAATQQVRFDLGQAHLEQQATFDDVVTAVLAKVDQHLTAAEHQRGMHRRVDRSWADRAADLRRGQGQPGDRPSGWQGSRAMWAYGILQNTVLGGVMAAGTAMFGVGDTPLAVWAGAIAVGAAALGGIVATWSKVQFRLAEQNAANEATAFKRAKARAKEQANAERDKQFYEQFFAGEVAAASDGTPRPPAPSPKIPFVIGPGDPRYAAFSKDRVAAERATLADDPRPYSVRPGREQSLDRIERQIAKLERAMAYAALRPGPRADAILKRANDKLANLWTEYLRHLLDGTDLSPDDEAPPISEVRSFSDLPTQEQERLIQRMIQDSNDNFPISRINAINILSGGPPGSTPTVAGTGLPGGDVQFVDSDGNVVLRREHKSTAGGYLSFAKQLEGAADQIFRAGEIWMQVPSGRNIADWVTSWQTRNAADLGNYTAVSLHVYDPAGNLLGVFDLGTPTGQVRDSGDTSSQDDQPQRTVPYTESGKRPKLTERLRRLWDASVGTPGGRAYFDPEETALRENALLVTAEPGTYVFDAHGSPNAIWVGDEKLSVEDVATLIEADPYFTGQTVRLFSCRTAEDPSGFAQQLADRLGVEVIAPNQLVGCRPNGDTYVTDKEIDQHGRAKLKWPPTGSWVSHHPTGNTESPRPASQPTSQPVRGLLFDEDDELPRIDDPEERAKIGRFLAEGFVIERIPGLDRDVLEPAREFAVPMSTHTDGTWIWSSGVRYYLLNHGVAPDPALLAHIRACGYRARKPEESEWRAAIVRLQG